MIYPGGLVVPPARYERTEHPVSDLHARLLAELDTIDRLLVHKVRFVNALRAVVELHAPKPYSERNPGLWLVCHGCDVEGYEWEHPEYPCSTIQAIARELEVSGGQ